MYMLYCVRFGNKTLKIGRTQNIEARFRALKSKVGSSPEVLFTMQVSDYDLIKSLEFSAKCFMERFQVNPAKRSPSEWWKPSAEKRLPALQQYLKVIYFRRLKERITR